jgi:hypothetical protein
MRPERVSGVLPAPTLVNVMEVSSVPSRDDTPADTDPPPAKATAGSAFPR